MADRQQRYDPRMGDESEDEQEQPYPADSSPVPTPSHHHADRHVRLDAKPTTFDERPPDENADIERADSSPSNDTHVTQVMRRVNYERARMKMGSRHPPNPHDFFAEYRSQRERSYKNYPSNPI